MHLRRWIAFIAVVVLAASAVVLVARPSQPQLVVVDGYVIGPDRTWADLGQPQPRCDALVARAIAQEQADSSAIVGHSLHEVLVLRDGQVGLAAWGGRPPFGVVLIDYVDGSQHAVTTGWRASTTRGFRGRTNGSSSASTSGTSAKFGA